MRKSHARLTIGLLAGAAVVTPVVAAEAAPIASTVTAAADPGLDLTAHQTPAQRAASLRNLAKARAAKAAKHHAAPKKTSKKTKAVPAKASTSAKAAAKAATAAAKAVLKAQAAAVKAQAKAASAAAKAQARAEAAWLREQARVAKAQAKAAATAAARPYGPVGTSEVTNMAHHGETYVPAPPVDTYVQQLKAEIKGRQIDCPNGKVGTMTAGGSVTGCY